jgi:hypothetical protein
LEAAWVAQQLGLPEQHGRGWDLGQPPAPADAVRLLQRVATLTDELLQAAEQNAPPGPIALDTEICLVQYLTDSDLWSAHPGFQPLPASWHSHVLTRMAGKLRQRGLQVRLVPFDAQAFATWLGSNRPVGEETRTEWAALQPVDSHTTPPSPRSL